MKNDKKYDTVWYRKHEKEQKKQKSKIIVQNQSKTPLHRIGRTPKRDGGARRKGSRRNCAHALSPPEECPKLYLFIPYFRTLQSNIQFELISLVTISASFVREILICICNKFFNFYFCKIYMPLFHKPAFIKIKF